MHVSMKLYASDQRVQDDLVFFTISIVLRPVPLHPAPLASGTPCIIVSIAVSTHVTGTGCIQFRTAIRNSNGTSTDGFVSLTWLPSYPSLKNRGRFLRVGMIEDLGSDTVSKKAGNGLELRTALWELACGEFPALC